MLGREVMSVFERTAQAQVTTFACGRATELFDVYDQFDKPERLQTDPIDVDMQALAYVALRLISRLHFKIEDIKRSPQPP